jgi:hypothetical protein
MSIVKEKHNLTFEFKLQTLLLGGQQLLRQRSVLQCVTTLHTTDPPHQEHQGNDKEQTAHAYAHANARTRAQAVARRRLRTIW